MERIQTYTITNQNITSPFLLCTYTSDSNRDLVFELYLSGLFGNGSYKFCVTKQSSGSGLFYQSPTSFTTLSSGVATAFLPTISIPVVTGDIVKVYAEGQSFDTSISGKVEVYDSAGPTSGSIADAVWDEALTAATHNVPTSAGRRVRQLGVNVIYSGTVVSATENTVVLHSGASSVNGAYDPSKITITDGSGEGQTRNVLEYIGATRTCVVDRNWKTTPVLGDGFDINADAGREHVNEGLARGGTINTITLNANASSYTNVYVGQVIFIRSGHGEDQACRVIAYDGTTKVATMAKDWHEIPNTTSAYVVLPTAIFDLNLFIQNIWSYTNRSLTTLSGVVSQIWTHAQRTLTSFINSSTTQNNDITAIRGDTFSYTFTNLSLIDFKKAYITIKKNHKDEDSDSAIQISTDDGLLYLNGCKITGGTGASMTEDIGNEEISVTISADVMRQLIYYPSHNYVYDLEIINTDNSVTTPKYGDFILVRDVTKKIT